MIITESMGPSGAGVLSRSHSSMWLCGRGNSELRRCPACGLELTEMDYWYYCPDCEKDFDIGQINAYMSM
jgi:hypothetical protein